MNGDIEARVLDNGTIEVTFPDEPPVTRAQKNAARYRRVDDALPRVLPPLTAHEAERAARAIYRKFAKPDGRKKPFGARTYYRRDWCGRTTTAKHRRCWLSTKPTAGNDRGWGRLIHDCSHDIFRLTYPNRNPHDPLHAPFEIDIARYVVERGWLDGKLKPKAKVKPTREQKRATDLARTEAAIARWTTKKKRAETALKKLATKRRRQARALAQEVA